MKLIKCILYNFLFIYLCRWILFGVYKINDYSNLTNVNYSIIFFFAFFMLYNNILLYKNKMKQIFIGCLILVIPYLSVELVQWILVKYQFVKSYRDVDILNIHLFDSNGRSYYFIITTVVILFVDLIFFIKKDKSKKQSKIESNSMNTYKNLNSISKSLNRDLIAIFFIVAFIVGIFLFMNR